MRHVLLLLMAIAAAIGLGALLTSGSDAAPATQSGQERFVVFEIHGREA